MADEGEGTQEIPVDRTVSWSIPVEESAPRPTTFSGAAPSPPPAPPARSVGAARAVPLLLGALLLGALGGLGGGYAAEQLGQDQDGPVVQESAPLVPAGTEGATPISAIAHAALPSVVFIAVEGGEQGAGVGSGFVIRQDGYIVTNSHVIAGAEEDGGTIEVEFSDDQQLEAEIVGRDESYDIAVIKVDRTGLQALQFGDSDQVQVGSGVVAVGAPLGLDSTVTSGIVSALNRPVIAGDMGNPSYINAIQTDAAINPGNSGGPLLDLNGRVIGVNSALAQIPDVLAVNPAGSIGLGFAIPANQVERTATQLIETGTSSHPVIGVLVDVAHTGEGARIREDPAGDQEPIVDGGPADLAGVQPGEVILAIDGQRIDNSSHLIVVLRSREVGDTVEVRLRDAEGQERTVTVTLQGSAQ